MYLKMDEEIFRFKKKNVMIWLILSKKVLVSFVQGAIEKRRSFHFHMQACIQQRLMK